VSATTKADQVRAWVQAGDFRPALKMVASWGRALRAKGHEETIKLAWAAASNPDFYRQLKKDPDALVAAGVAALKLLYK